jgi:hypothetical protein
MGKLQCLVWMLQNLFTLPLLYLPSQIVGVGVELWRPIT